MAVSLAMEPEVVEARLAAGRIRCGGCDAPLSPWGYGRERVLRMLCGVRSVRPRRGYCRSCQTTHLLLPAWSLPGRRDGAEVIGQALVLGAQGDGHRTIARQLDREPGTVRGWLRAARRGAPALYRAGCDGRSRWIQSPRAPSRPGRRWPMRSRLLGVRSEAGGCTSAHIRGSERESWRWRSSTAGCCPLDRVTRPGTDWSCAQGDPAAGMPRREIRMIAARTRP